MTPVAWDLETVPLARPACQERLTKEIAQDREPGFHPLLTRIVSVAMCVRTPAGNLNYWSRTALAEEDERTLLEDLWAKLGEMQPVSARGPARGKLLVGFNSKGFDAPVLAARSAWHAIDPTNAAAAVLDTYPYSFRPHCDLMGWLRQPYGLHDLCQFLGVDSPKGGGDGSGVQALLAEGRVEEIEAYNRRDVRATLECFERISKFLFR